MPTFTQKKQLKDPKKAILLVLIFLICFGCALKDPCESDTSYSKFAKEEGLFEGIYHSDYHGSHFIFINDLYEKEVTHKLQASEITGGGSYQVHLYIPEGSEFHKEIEKMTKYPFTARIKFSGKVELSPSDKKQRAVLIMDVHCYEVLKIND